MNDGRFGWRAGFALLDRIRHDVDEREEEEINRVAARWALVPPNVSR